MFLMIPNGDELEMKIYTARGDQGQTDLLGERVTKDDPRIDLIGDLDESTSSIGFARSLTQRVLILELGDVSFLCAIVLISGMLVTLPAVASTFAYVFTMDGYMLAVLLSVASVLCVKKSRYGFLPGAVCLAFSQGTYQA